MEEQMKYALLLYATPGAREAATPVAGDGAAGVSAVLQSWRPKGLP